MFFRLRMPQAKKLFLSLLIISFLFSGCSVPSLPFGQTTSNPISLTVGGKLDVESQLLTKMYVLLLRQAGFSVTEKARTGDNAGVFKAITTGKIDLYPEFTSTGLGRLQIPVTNVPTQDYQAVKQGYEQKYHITWLDMSPQLNDTYGICVSQSSFTNLGLSNISSMTAHPNNLTIVGSDDGIQEMGVVEKAYNFTLQKLPAIKEVEKTFQAVRDGQAEYNVCYTTSPLISQYNFVLLADDKNVFPIYNPAPIVRDSVLKQAPQIATTLNSLAPKLTSDVSRMLQGQVVAGFSIEDVASNWLKSQGLLR